MSLQRLEYFTRRMLQIVRANLSGSSMALAMLTVFLLMVGIFQTGHRAGQHLLPTWAAPAKAVIYLKPQASSKDMDELAGTMGKWQEIGQVRVVTAAEGRKRLQEELGKWKDVLGSVPESAFPPSLEIELSSKLRSQDETEALCARIRQYPQVEDVYYGKIWVERLESFLRPVRLLGFGAAGLLGFLALLTVYHSTILALQAREDEVEICNILGATPLFTKIPFYIESIVSGSISGIIASICIALIVSWTNRALPMPIAVALVHNGAEAFLLGAELAGCGVALSLAGRWLAFRQVLKIDNPLADSKDEYVQSS